MGAAGSRTQHDLAGRAVVTAQPRECDGVNGSRHLSAGTKVRLCHPVRMNRKTLSFVALTISILYAAGFVVIDGSQSTYAVIGGAVVALAWIAVGYLGKPDERPAPRAAPQDQT